MSRKGAIYEGYSAPHGRESFGGIIFAGRKTNGVLLGFDDDRLTEVIIEMETEASQLEQTFEALEYDLRKKYGAPKTIPDPTNRQIAWSTASKSGKLTVVGLALVRPDGNVLVYYSDLAAANRAEAKKKKDI